MSESTKRPNLFERLQGALEEGVRFAKGELPLRTTEVPDQPPAWHAQDIRNLRERLEMSQGVFGGLLNVSLKTVQGWEQGRASRRKPPCVCCKSWEPTRTSFAKSLAFPCAVATASRSA